MAMFLKIVRGCPDEFLAVAATPALDYDIYDEVVSCHFTRYKEPGPDGVFGMAHIKVREPVKTADCPGYAEIEKNVDLTGAAFLMNQQGRTIDKFLPQAARGNAGAPSVDARHASWPIPGPSLRPHSLAGSLRIVPLCASCPSRNVAIRGCPGGPN